MALKLKPLYLAESMEQLEKLLGNDPTPSFIPEKLFECFLGANEAWLDGDDEMAFLLYNRVTAKLEEISFLNNEQIVEVLEKIETLTQRLKARYETMKGEEVTSNDNKINELNTVRLDNFSPQYDECLIEGLFSKYGEIKKVWFNVETERGFGFVEFEQRCSAFMAISEENGKNYDGHDIIVEHFDDNINRFLPTSVFISKENLTADQVVYKFDDLNSKSEKGSVQKSKAKSTNDSNIDKFHRLDSKSKTMVSVSERNVVTNSSSNGGIKLHNKIILLNVMNDYESEADLRSLFTRFGKIINVHIYKLGEEERNGFVVVEFADVVSAVNAKVKMSSFKMPSGELMKINLCTADEIEEKRKAFECENTDENWNTVCLSSNMADLNVDEQIECSNSISAVSEKTVKTDEFIVYVYGFESDIQNEEELKSLFEKFGEVKWVKIFNQDENTKADDAIRSIYGCVSYDNEADAKVAQQEMNGHIFPFSGESMIVELKIFDRK